MLRAAAPTLRVCVRACHCRAGCHMDAGFSGAADATRYCYAVCLYALHVTAISADYCRYFAAVDAIFARRPRHSSSLRHAI